MVSRRETLIARNQIWRAWCWSEVKKLEVVRVMALVYNSYVSHRFCYFDREGASERAMEEEKKKKKRKGKKSEGEQKRGKDNARYKTFP